MKRTMTGKAAAVAAGIAWAAVTAAPAKATITTGMVTGGNAGGSFVKLTPPLPNPFGPPNSVGNDTFQSNNLFGFDEDQNILISAPLATNVGTNPIPAGTIVASHYIFFDPGPTRTLIGTVEFDSDVLGIMTSTTNLANSDFLANTGVNYLNPSARGFEPGDTVVISAPRQITVNLTAGSPGDYLRVLTELSPAAIAPEPATAALVLPALLLPASGVALRKLRRRNRS